ncbi:reelin domain-containing protein 1-like [Limanda limanda]|uniref:reelin domain-containing protein 1-like n=1 Tax=Limanda limanda TaxID=27771 RepID=UPI0029C87649|nr:reelin domain-containing protein 1-like [Limanda limanda]
MPSTLLCLGVVLFSLAPPTLSFSRGASRTSCQEMIPGHIRAQPQDPFHSFVTLRTSASSYLPGQLITVTVRSSRDFMGFLLQARSVEGSGGRAEAGAGPGVGVRARSGVKTGVRSTRAGPVVMGGSWTLTPPGTHTLRCLSDGDTLTHSDKQLKRNLSFVWRAPDAPMGDIRFYITVVQSYFVYWAGIESAVVHDGSRRSVSGSKTPKVDGETSALQEYEVAALPALRAYSASNKPTNQAANPATTTGHSLPGSSGTQRYRSLEPVTRPSLGRDHLTNQAAIQPSPTYPVPYSSHHPSPAALFPPVPSTNPSSSPFTSSKLNTAPLRSLYHPPMPSPSPVPSQKLTMGQSLLIQHHIAPSDPQPDLTPATQRTLVHPNPEPHPNLDPNFKLNLGYELKTHLPKTDTKPKRPPNPPGTPDKDGKYPNIIPRHSAWELGMLLGCSAGLGMVLVVGVRYMYRQACGKRTAVTLNDREREYERGQRGERGERGLIHVQECGDLVRVRRIRENSFVLLAEYDILTPPGD